MFKYMFVFLMVLVAVPAFAQKIEVGEVFYPSDSTIQNRDKAMSITPFVGSSILPAENNQNTRPTLGIRGGYNFDEHRTVETVISYSLGRDRDARESNNLKYGVDLLYHFLLPDHLSRYVPFAAIGGGGQYVTTPDTPGLAPISSKNIATVNFGGGIKYYLADDIALRGDMRSVTSFGNSTRMNVEYSAGVAFAFGGVKKAVAPVVACAKIEPETVIVEKIVERIVEVPVVVEKVVEKTVTLPLPVVVKDSPAANLEVKSEKALQVESQLKILRGQNFALNGTSLTPSGKKALAANLEILKKYPAAKILVAGHASKSGSDEYNQKLSLKRAVVVRDLLVKGGIEEKRVSVKGFGSSQPALVEVDPADVNSNAALLNRRVELLISGI